ncbi:MAG: DUF790 family protein [Planctomycetota bacterium]
MVSARAALGCCSVHGGAVVVRYLTRSDAPALRELIEECESLVGQPVRILAQRLEDKAAAGPSPSASRVATEVLRQVFGSEVRAAVSPVRARAVVFRLASCRQERSTVLERAGRQLGVSAAQVAAALLADLPQERRVVAPAAPVTPESIALRSNLGIQQALLQRSTRVAVSVEGSSRAIVRHAKLRGLICTVHRCADSDSMLLRLSGPLSLFRRTRLYGRATGELVPLLAWCRRFRLTADCVVHGRPANFVLSTGDPICPGNEPRRYDSRLEKRFAREFASAGPAWDVVREPEPVEADGTLIFPDFLLRHRDDPSRRWLLEIVGFWTADYLRKKLFRLRGARIANLILCVDATLRCSEDDLPEASRVVWFRKSIDPTHILRIVEPEAA